MIACSAGITTIVLLPVLPPPQLLLSGLIFPFIFRRHRLLAAFLLGACWALGWAHWQLEHRLSYQGRSDWQFGGTITEVISQSDQRIRFDLAPRNMEILPDQARAGRSFALRSLRLSWYSPTTVLNAGDTISGVVRLKPPHGLINPGGFDYELQLLRQGVDATGYIRRLDSHVSAPVGYWSVRDGLERWQRERYGNAAGLVSALTLGKRQEISTEQWQLLRATGTVHLAVISGLHIGFIALAVFWLSKRLPGRLGLNVGRAAPVWLSVATAAGYVLLAGASLPVIRAFIMVSVFLIAELRLWRVSAWSRWWIALALVLILMPLSPYQAGFWLSFGAVAVLIWIASLKQKSRLGLWAQWGIFVGMTPLLAYLFSGVSWVAPLVNLLAIPYVAALLPLIFIDHLAGSLGLEWLQPAIEVMVNGFWYALHWVAGFGKGYMPVARISPLILLLAMAGSWLWLQPPGFPGRYLGVVFWLPWLVGPRQLDAPDQFSAWVFDVGQGSAVMVEVGRYRLLFDSGPGYRSGGSAAEWAIWPYLERQGISAIDDLILSHDDLDHIGGAERMIATLKPRRIFTGGERFLAAPGGLACYAGQHWRVGSVDFQMLAGSVGRKDNDRSCVLKVSTSSCSLLLTGDIGVGGEAKLPFPDRPLSWLLAAHHGSASSTSAELLRQWQPADVIYSAGYANHFGHPAAAVVARVEQSGARQWNTADSGAIRLRATAQGCRTSSQRMIQRRFWAASPQSSLIQGHSGSPGK